MRDESALSCRGGVSGLFSDFQSASHSTLKSIGIAYAYNTQRSHQAICEQIQHLY
jgi:hypothetical protein